MSNMRAYSLQAGIGNRGQSQGAELLTCGIWCSLQVGRVTTELLYRTPSWGDRELLSAEPCPAPTPGVWRAVNVKPCNSDWDSNPTKPRLRLEPMIFWKHRTGLRGFPGHASGKEPACQCRKCKRGRFYSWVRKIPWSRKRQPTLVLFPGESQGQRTLVGYSP